jgi:hypothetical protein
MSWLLLCLTRGFCQGIARAPGKLVVEAILREGRNLVLSLHRAGRFWSRAHLGSFSGPFVCIKSGSTESILFRMLVINRETCGIVAHMCRRIQCSSVR